MQVKDTDALYKVMTVVIMCEVNLFRTICLCILFVALGKIKLES